jgi:hypothetical protein
LFDAAKATSVTVARPGGGSAAIGRDAASGEWSVFLIGADGRELGRWPAAPERVRAALRILATLAPERPADAGVVPEASACSIVVTAEGGVKQSMTISERVLGGQVVVATGERAGWVGSDVAEMLVKERAARMAGFGRVAGAWTGCFENHAQRDRREQWR